jgi:DNA-binding transcriptional ArsR family regulator
MNKGNRDTTPKETAQDRQDALVFKALAGSDRRRILDMLRHAPMTTGQICEQLGWLNRCTVMQHLGVLEKARLIIPKKAGRTRWNYLDVSPIQRIHERWIEAYAMPSASLLNKLQQDLEGSPSRS